MLHLLKKLKLYTKLGRETIHKAPISIHIKIHLWFFVGYQHLQKYFYNWHMKLNYYFICKINIMGNFMLKSHWYSIKCPYFDRSFSGLWKIVNDSKNYVSAVPMIMSFNLLEYFYSGKISFFLFVSFLSAVRRSQTRKNDVFFQKSWTTHK